MKLLKNPKITDIIVKVECGDIIVFSDACAYLIVQTDIEYLAVQLLNNGNQELGYINYINASIERLKDSLIEDLGIPTKVLCMSEASIILD